MFTNQTFSLQQLGWKHLFQQQLTLEEFETTFPARVIEVHKSQYRCISEQGTQQLPAIPAEQLQVGDWVLLSAKGQYQRRLQPYSQITRKAPGTGQTQQVMASNVDNMIIVSAVHNESTDLDDTGDNSRETRSNINRIERFVTLAHASQCQAILVLSKTDICPNYLSQQKAIANTFPHLPLYCIGGEDTEALAALRSECPSGSSSVVLGLSGVGKSTLVNKLVHTSGAQPEKLQATASVRTSDGRGRHTTTARSIHLIPEGGVIIDVPGIRELQLSDSEQSLKHTFADIEHLAKHCRFSNCQHQSEPGCQVQAALQQGTLSQRRLNNYQKLLKEQQHQSRSQLEHKQSDKRLSKLIRRSQKDKQHKR